jgi:hypothetical protein
LTQQCHSGSRTICLTTLTRSLPVLALILCAGAVGCRHKAPPYAIPLGALVPVELAEPPADEDQASIETLPLPDLDPIPSTPPVPPVQRRRPAASKEEAQPVAPADTAPAELAIGSLSTGIGVTPQIQQQAQEMISSLVRRITLLSSRMAEQRRVELDRVRNFLKQAQQALNTGDTDGAKNLATKARLLMDDLEK